MLYHPTSVGQVTIASKLSTYLLYQLPAGPLPQDCQLRGKTVFFFASVSPGAQQPLQFQEILQPGGPVNDIFQSNVWTGSFCCGPAVGLFDRQHIFLTVNTGHYTNVLVGIYEQFCKKNFPPL